MLVMLTDNQIFYPQKVCQTCLLADQSGQPRWQQGHLSCGHAIQKLTESQPDQYQCCMGFRLVKVD